MGCTSLALDQKSTSTTAEQILSLIYAHSNSYSPEYAANAAVLRKIQNFIDAERPVHLILPAFPAKSPNRDKTLGALPDMADLEGLRMLNRLAQQIRELHQPGARILICSDGRVFADVVQVSDMDVENYKRGIERMIAWHDLAHLETFHLEDVFGSLSFNNMRERLTRNFAVPVEQLRENLNGDPALRLMFNGIHRFMFEDQLFLSPHLSREKARQHSKQLAYQVIQRSNAWSRLLEQRFPASVRLSIHPQVPQSEKLGVQLVPAENKWATPWHNVLVTDGLNKKLMKRAEAEAAGAVLTRSDEGYLFYHQQRLEVRHAL